MRKRLFLCVVLFLVACEEKGNFEPDDAKCINDLDCPDSCLDTCDSVGAVCGEVCGAPCGVCDGPEVCSEGTCVPPEECTATCDSEQMTCGSICGQDCGQCVDGLSCLGGQCVTSGSCEDCALNLAVAEVGPTTITINVNLEDDIPPPRIADLHFQLGGEVELMGVEAGPSVLNSDKSIYKHSVFGNTYNRTSEGRYQVLIYGLSTSQIAPGRLVRLHLRRTGLGPVSIALEKRDKTLAPSASDRALQVQDYGRVLVIE